MILNKIYFQVFKWFLRSSVKNIKMGDLNERFSQKFEKKRNRKWKEIGKLGTPDF